MTRLEVRDLHVAYGDLEVVHGVSFDVGPGEVVAMLGANGAGKSTIMRAISGLVPVAKGTVTLGGTSLVGLDAHAIAAAGLRHVPEGRRIFAPLTVEENLRLGGYVDRKSPATVGQRIEEVYERFPRLRERRRQLGGTLSGGEQQMLAVGRALVSNPSIVALDEPSLGLSPKMTTTILDTIAQIAKEGTGVLLVEQNAREALKIADRAYVLELGRIALSGPAAEVAADPRIRATYLGADLDEETGATDEITTGGTDG
jgi:branched-chain amino acid transport system ATP-binding protein